MPETLQFKAQLVGKAKKLVGLEKDKEKKKMDLTWGKEKVGTTREGGIWKNLC